MNKTLYHDRVNTHHRTFRFLTNLSQISSLFPERCPHKWIFMPLHAFGKYLAQGRPLPTTTWGFRPQVESMITMSLPNFCWMLWSSFKPYYRKGSSMSLPFLSPLSVTCFVHSYVQLASSVVSLWGFVVEGKSQKKGQRGLQLLCSHRKEH